MDYKTYYERTNYLFEMSTRRRLISLGEVAGKYGSATWTMSRIQACL